MGIRRCLIVQFCLAIAWMGAESPEPAQASGTPPSPGLARVEIQVSNALLVDSYEELNNNGNLPRFARKVRERYTEGTLQRLLCHRDSKTREAAIVALRLLGTMRSNQAAATCLYDENPEVQEMAEATLWAIWFRADAPEHNRELRRLTHLIEGKEFAKALTGLDALIQKAPKFAEAYNQRAILYWTWGQYEESIADCERALKLNPYHFGALSGMGQCYLRLDKPAEALKAFRRAHKINPAMHGIADNIEALEQMINERGGRKDERK